MAHCYGSARREVLDGCRGRSSGLPQRTAVADQVSNQRLVGMTSHVDDDMMFEHDGRVYVLGDVAERAGIVRIRIVALFELRSLMHLAPMCMHGPSAQNEHEAHQHEGGEEAKHRMQR